MQLVHASAYLLKEVDALKHIIDKVFHKLTIWVSDVEFQVRQIMQSLEIRLEKRNKTQIMLSGATFKTEPGLEEDDPATRGPPLVKPTNEQVDCKELMVELEEFVERSM
jgi:hypothetical protein